MVIILLRISSVIRSKELIVNPYNNSILRSNRSAKLIVGIIISVIICFNAIFEPIIVPNHSFFVRE